LAVFGKPRYLGLVDIGDLKLSAGSWIVIETLRGLEIGLLGGTLSREQEDKYRSACLEEPSDEHTRGPEPMLQEVGFVEPASPSQVKEHGARRLDEEAVLVRSRQILRSHQFQMKLVDVEYTMDRKKLFLYFTSEQRVDFRAYVRDLAKEFRIRIEMRQIGVRDEAKTVRGVAPCGRPCCCSYWLHRFTPINIRMVKEQNLALNPTKISGICGRLMCCMFYEHSTYSELWKTLPSPGTKIKTAQGNYVLEGVDLHTETVRVGFPEGGETPIPIADFNRFKETISRGEVWQREEKKEVERDRKPVLPRVALPRLSLSSRALKPSNDGLKMNEMPDSSAKNNKNNKKSKPEKISIEEHMAERADVTPLHGQTSQGSSGTGGGGASKRRHLKHKDTLPSRNQEQNMRGAAGQGSNVQAVKEKTPSHKERHKTFESQSKNEHADSQKDARKGGQGKSQTHGAAHSRRRARHKGGDQGHERPGQENANADSTGKRDS